jgi:hypothetical protein
MWAVCPQQPQAQDAGTMLTDLIDGDLAGLPDRARGLLERVCRPGQHDQRVANTCDFLKKIIDTDHVIAALIGGTGANAYADRPAHVRADVLMTGLDSILHRNDLSSEASSLVASVGAVARQRERYRLFALAAPDGPEAVMATLEPRDALDAELGADGVAALDSVVGRLWSSAPLHRSVRKVFEDTQEAIERSPNTDPARKDLKAFCESVEAVRAEIESARTPHDDLLSWFYVRTRQACRFYRLANIICNPGSLLIGEELGARTEQVSQTRAVLEEKDPYVREWFDEITNKIAPLHDGIRTKDQLVSAIGLLTGPAPAPSEAHQRVQRLREGLTLST